MSDDKVIRPKVIQWGGDFCEQNFWRLMETPTYDQLEILQRNLEDQFGKLPVLDMFVLLFGAVLNGMPSLPPLTAAEHGLLYS